MADPAVSALTTTLDALARTPRLLVALDFDGVLAPIVAHPPDARPLPESTAAVNALAGLPDTTVVLLSGRGVADLRAVSGLGPPVRMVGSHGGEFDDGGEVLGPGQKALKQRMAEALAAIADGAPGVVLEDKPAGVAVHVRNAEPETGERVLDAVRAGPAGWDGVVATAGKKVLDLTVLDTSKGAALEMLRERFSSEGVLFAGDDVTDETAFARLRPGDVGVKVGDGETAAGFRVASPEEFTGVLEHLLAARRAHASG